MLDRKEGKKGMEAGKEEVTEKGMEEGREKGREPGTRKQGVRLRVTQPVLVRLPY